MRRGGRALEWLRRGTSRVGAPDSANRSRRRRMIQIVLAVLVAFVVPVLLLDALVGEYGRTR